MRLNYLQWVNRGVEVPRDRILPRRRDVDHPTLRRSRRITGRTSRVIANATRAASAFTSRVAIWRLRRRWRFPTAPGSSKPRASMSSISAAAIRISPRAHPRGRDRAMNAGDTHCGKRRHSRSCARRSPTSCAPTMGSRSIRTAASSSLPGGNKRSSKRRSPLSRPAST